MLRIVLPVFDERAEEVYHRAHSETKRTEEMEGVSDCATDFRLL